MTVTTDLLTTVAQLQGNAEIMNAIVTGPASGPESQVDTPGGVVKTFARIALEAGSLANNAYRSSASITRPADTALYAAGDVIGAATGSSAAIEFANIGPAIGGHVLITTMRFRIDISTVPTGLLGGRLECYGITPPSALGDNAAFDLAAGDRASYLGALELGTPVKRGSALYVETTWYGKQLLVPEGGSMFAYLVNSGGYIPVSGAHHDIEINSVGI